MNGEEYDDEYEGVGVGSSRTAMQIMVDISRDLLQAFDVKTWNAFAADLSHLLPIPTAWEPGEHPPPIGIILDFRRLQRAHYRLIGIDLSRCWLDEANFEGSNLKDAKMGSCSNATFKDACLQGADFSNCDISGCNFTGADLRDINFKDATYDPADPPTGLPPELLAKCKAEPPDPSNPPASTSNLGRFAARPIRACVTINEVPW